MENLDEEIGEEKIMSKIQTKLIISERLGYEHEFQGGKIKKTLLWSMILKNVMEKDPTFSFSRNDVIVKFSNCFTTYKRIKKRHRETGKSSTTWEFFDQFDEVYGDSHFVDPSESLFLSMEEAEADSDNTDNKSDLNRLSVLKTDSNYDNTNTGKAYEENAQHSKKRKFSDIIEVIKYETKQAERHHRELLAVEREKIKVLQEIKDLMEAFLND